MNVALIPILIALALSGCARHGAETKLSDNAEFDISRLFTVDGCSVYRFADGGNWRYFTNCSGTTMTNESCGKNCSRNVSIPGGKP